MKKPAPTLPSGRVIVLDTAALIAGTDNLYALGGLVDVESGATVSTPTADNNVTFFTVPEVITEVRDRKARARLALLDGAIVVRPPSSEALAAVINFAKATGDFPVLSMTDLKVIALCWMLEMERNAGQYLKPPPERVLVKEIRCGTLIPFEALEKRERNAQKAARLEANDDDDWTVVKSKANVHEPVAKNVNDVNADPTPTETNDLNLDDSRDHVSPIEGEKKTERKRRRRRRKKKAILSEDEVGRLDVESEAHLVDGASDMSEAIQSLHEIGLSEGGDENPSTVENVGEEEGEEDEEGWINEENLEEHLARERREEEETRQDHERIGCVTTDFAMQNTMLQMGLKLLSVDGRRVIRKIKHFAFRCHSCGTITAEQNRVFCPRCGNATMHRVAFKVDKNGVARSYLNPKKKPILRGTKYPIPMPRGGRYNRDLILCEDQIDPVKQKRLQKQRERLNVDVLDPSSFYNAGARYDPNNRPLVVGYGRKNPNEVQRTNRRKR